MTFRRTVARQAGRLHLVYGATIAMVAVALLTGGCGSVEQTVDGSSVLESESTVTTIATATSTTLSLHERIQQEQAVGETASPSSSAVEQSQPTTTASSSPNTGESVNSGGMKYTLLQVKLLDSLKNIYGSAPDRKTNGKFLWVVLTMENTSRETLSVYPLHGMAVSDSEGRVFEALDDLIGYAPEELQNNNSVEYSPGVPVDVLWVFEVAANAKELRLLIKTPGPHFDDSWLGVPELPLGL